MKFLTFAGIFIGGLALGTVGMSALAETRLKDIAKDYVRAAEELKKARSNIEDLRSQVGHYDTNNFDMHMAVMDVLDTLNDATLSCVDRNIKARGIAAKALNNVQLPDDSGGP